MENIEIWNKTLNHKKIKGMWSAQQYKLNDLVGINSNNKAVEARLVGNKVIKTGFLWWKKKELVWKVIIPMVEWTSEKKWETNRIEEISSDKIIGKVK